jgi:hypothetical protein
LRCVFDLSPKQTKLGKRVNVEDYDNQSSHPQQSFAVLGERLHMTITHEALGSITMITLHSSHYPDNSKEDVVSNDDVKQVGREIVAMIQKTEHRQQNESKIVEGCP